MSTLRYDPTSNEWIIFAPSRARQRLVHRRETPQKQGPVTPPGCPFCPGNERLTPPEIDAVRHSDGPNSPTWEVRVIPNLFPALRIEEDPQSLTCANRFFRYRGGCGAHEVIIESPQHDCFLGHQPVDQFVLLFQMLQRRHNDLLRDPRFQAILIFKNNGEAAGTTIRHPHCQLIATPVVPRQNRLRESIAEEYYDRTGHNLYARLLEEELEARSRVLFHNEHFAAILPYASQVPFETWILPRFSGASFGSTPSATLPALARLLKRTLAQLHAALDDPDFNLIVDTVSRGEENQPWYLWHIRILPRLMTRSGFELATGMPINTVLPEDAASFLRDTDPAEEY